MRKLESLTFITRSGATYRFRVYAWGNDYKPLPAVYVVMERTIEPGGSPRYAPIYVGETADLATEFENHEESDCFQMHMANTVAVLQAPDAARRSRVVADLIASLNPPGNRRSA